ncbi:MAG: T9SS type A sorting domain-containing protein [Rhodothermales bacterium]|nr:T9SS type A sorting domain-containing protein [Rhodothermales bacterium]
MRAQGGAPRWDDRFQGFGVDGAIYALARGSDGSVYAAGSFSRAGGLPARNIARWDGRAWRAVGIGLGLGSEDVVNALYVDTDGRLYAGGNFAVATQSDGTTIEAHNLAMWNGARWEAMGSGVDDEVFDLIGDGDGALYIGGVFLRDGLDEFDLGKVAVWDGNDLSPVGDGLGTSSSVSIQAMAFDSQGTLYAAGRSLAGGVFRWNGSTWSSFGALHTGDVYAMAIDSQDRIYVGGAFMQVTQPDATIVPAGRLARWESTGWDVLLGGVNGEVRSLAIDDADRVYAGGLFLQAGSLVVNHVARWDGAWGALAQGAGDDAFEEVSTLLWTPDEALFVGGDVSFIDGRVANGFGVWEGETWGSFAGAGLDDTVNALAYDAVGGLYAGGAFTYAGLVKAPGIAYWDGEMWAAVGGGVDGTVYALLVDLDGTVYVAGDFQHARQPGGVSLPTSNIAAWDGETWMALDTGFDGPVYALALDASGALVAGGAFGYDGSEQSVLNYTAVWDGAAWVALGDGMDDEVLALATGSDGTVYAGGAFSSAGGVANTAYIAQWTGAEWEALAADALLDNTVRALAVDDAGMVYIGGDFTSVTNSLAAGHVVGWNGTQWVFLGGAQSNGVAGCCVTALAIGEVGSVYVGGSFEGVNRPVGPTLAAAGLAVYSNSAWQPLTSGVDGAPAVLAVSGEDLYVGGAFRVAGGFASSHLGRWSSAVSYVSTEDETPALPERYDLSAIYPNPFNPTAHFSLSVQQTQQVRVEVYDMLGRRVAQLFDGVLLAGQSRGFVLEAGAWRSGAYLVRVAGDSFNATRSVMLVK